MTNVTFPVPSIEEWKEKGEAALKGKSIDTLAPKTYENITLKPLYTKEDQNLEKISQFPGQADFRRGIGFAGNQWEVSQKITAENAESLKELLASAFERGQTTVSFEVSEKIVPGLEAVLKEFNGKYPYSVNAKDIHGAIIELLAGLSNAEEGKGYVAADPLAVLAEKGAPQDNIAELYDAFYESVKKAADKLPEVRTILADTTPYHNGGANAVQELAIALSTAVFHIEELKARGLAVEEILSKLVFQFAIGANFFMELAKLRAARILWSKVAGIYGAGEEQKKMMISAETSRFTKTVYDPYVNMLRAGTEAFAAVLGGVQYLHVSPYNEPEGAETEFSGRIARNTQLILKEESLLTKTVDPAGGSWYVEHLTNEIAEKAWELFLEIDDKGGILEVLKSGWLQEQIAEVMKKRHEDIFTRKQTIVGTNKYANLEEVPLSVFFEDKDDNQGEAFIAAIPQVRLSEPYERLRAKASKLAGDGAKLTVGLITLGSLKEYKPRMDFVTGFLSPGGIKTEEGGELQTVDDALDFIGKSGYGHYCICSSNDRYDEIGPGFVKALKDKYPDVKYYLAGVPNEGQQEWLDQGIEDFIHIKSNCYETLSSLLTEMEVGDRE